MKRKSVIVEKEDVRNAYQLFVDVKRSDKFIKMYESEFMFSSSSSNGDNSKSPEGAGGDHFVDASEMDIA